MESSFQVFLTKLLTSTCTFPFQNLPPHYFVGVDLAPGKNSVESLSNARKCKSKKYLYQQAISDLEVKGIASNLYTIEIESLRHWLHTSQMALLKGPPLKTKKMARKIMDEAANKVIGATQVIF